MNPISKRAQLIGESLTLFVVTMIVIGLLLIFFFMIKSIDVGVADPEKMKSLSLEDSAMFSLEAYVDTPVEIEYGEEKITLTMAELIRLTKIDNSYDEILKINTQEIFKEVYGEDYHLSITSNDSNLLSVGRSLALPQKNEKLSPEKFILKSISLQDLEIDLYLFEK